jgi:hypothetical protein
MPGCHTTCADCPHRHRRTWPHSTTMPTAPCYENPSRVHLKLITNQDIPLQSNPNQTKLENPFETQIGDRIELVSLLHTVNPNQTKLENPFETHIGDRIESVSLLHMLGNENPYK